jgi:hypothetical protein
MKMATAPGNANCRLEVKMAKKARKEWNTSVYWLLHGVPPKNSLPT